jgi:hypothetical protein
VWLVNDRGLSGAQRAEDDHHAAEHLAGLGAGLLADWCCRRFDVSRPMFLACYVAVLAPFIVAFRLLPPGHPLFAVGMAASVLFFSGFYGPCFAIFQGAAPDHLRSTITGLTIITLQAFVLGLGAVVIGFASDLLRAQQAAQTLTGPLLTADLIGLSSMFLLFMLALRREPVAAARPMPT